MNVRLRMYIAIFAKGVLVLIHREERCVLNSSLSQFSVQAASSYVIHHEYILIAMCTCKPAVSARNSQWWAGPVDLSDG